MNIKVISSLHKVFPKTEPEEVRFAGKESVFLNETYFFQIAYKAKEDKKWFKIKAGCTKKHKINIYSVGLVPSELPAYKEYDDNYITVEPGLFPDVLKPVGEGYECFAQPDFWRALWVEVTPCEGEAGECGITIDFIDYADSVISSAKTSLNVIEGYLPKQELIHTEWFHYDCISNYYNVPMMSQAHWLLIEKYIKAAAECGINMILTPIFTPPLDTEVGGERPTMQLVDVYKSEEGYSFGFDKLKRFIDMCLKCGIEYFEMSHLFTQWGVEHAPKIIAEAAGRKEKIFGWDTEAAGAEYKKFIDAFLPELTETLRDWGVAGRVWFHISDEPSIKHLESYRAAHDIVKKHLSGFKMMDALSDIDFYETGLVENPIPASSHIEPFLKKEIKGLWTYYCCAQNIDVSNRFFAMPSARNRILGVQLFKYGISGFLHWGYNFWNSQFTKRALNPFVTTDADCAFPSGDAFLVYPGEDGPLPSIRMKVLAQALYDLRALKMLAKLKSHKYVVDIAESGLEEEITFKNYPKDLSYLINIRKKINDEIEKCLS